MAEISAIVVGTGLCERTTNQPGEQAPSLIQKNWKLGTRSPHLPHQNFNQPLTTVVSTTLSSAISTSKTVTD